MKTRIFTSLAIALLLIATLVMPAVAAEFGELTASATVGATISITVSDTAGAAGVLFGSVNVGDDNVEDSGIGVATPSARVTVDAGTTIPVDLAVKGTNFGTGFPVSQAKWNTSYTTVGATSMSTSNAEFAGPLDATDTADIWFWLDVPESGITAQIYNSTFTITAVTA